MKNVTREFAELIAHHGYGRIATQTKRAPSPALGTAFLDAMLM